MHEDGEHGLSGTDVTASQWSEYSERSFVGGLGKELCAEVGDGMNG